MFPGGRPPSICSAKKLNYCVRNGNRCDLLAITTDYFFRRARLRIISTEPVTFVFRLIKRSVRLSLTHNSKFLGQALDLLVSVSSMRYRTYTSDLSTT